MTALPWLQVVAVAGGAAVGGLLRWWVGLWMNGPALRLLGFPLGTLVVNCLGGLLVGAALLVFERSPNELGRLLLVTGLLGGLTTFSTFSAESLFMIQRGEWPLAVAHTLAHVLGSLLCAALGYAVAGALLE